MPLDSNSAQIPMMPPENSNMVAPAHQASANNTNFLVQSFLLNRVME